MAIQHQVTQGECISSIAFRYGLSPETVWDYHGNSELRTLRENPNVLRPGDVVVIPDKQQKHERIDLNAQHRFRRRGVPEQLKINLEDFLGVRANESFRLLVGDREQVGTFDESGTLEVFVPPDAQKAILLVGSEGAEEKLELDIGWLDPVTEPTGLQARLENLGYDCGGVDNVVGPQTREALTEFQQDEGLEVTGEPDEATRQRLVEMHSS